MMITPDSNDLLDNLAANLMGQLWELVSLLPGGTDDDRCSLATTAIGEILARTLSTPITAPVVAEMTNAVLARHSLTWRLVQAS